MRARSEKHTLATDAAIAPAHVEDTLLGLLCALLPAVAHRLRGSIPLAIANRGISLCGIVLLVSPAALWMAWSATVLYTILLAVVIAFVLIMVLLWLGPGDHY